MKTLSQIASEQNKPVWRVIYRAKGIQSDSRVSTVRLYGPEKEAEIVAGLNSDKRKKLS